MKRLWLAILMVLAMAGAAYAGTITPTVVSSSDIKSGQAQVLTWAHLVTGNPTGVAQDVLKYRSLEVQIKGTWGAGTITIQGSDDGTNYVNLRALSTLSAVSQAADPTTLIVLFETPNYIKPVLTGANGTDDITVTITGRN